MTGDWCVFFPYNKYVEYIIIDNPVPTPEEMAEILGLDPGRVVAIRKIMSTPVRRKKSAVAGSSAKAPAGKKSSTRRRPAGQHAAKS